MISRIEEKSKILKERYNKYCNSLSNKQDCISYAKFIKSESENDPEFFVFLYDELMEYEESPNVDTVIEDLKILSNM